MRIFSLFRIIHSDQPGNALAVVLMSFTMAFLSQPSSVAQTGPGGVGDRTGASSLEVWLDARDIDGDDDFTDNPANGTLISTWSDKSGNGNNATQTGNNRPAYNTSGTFNAVNFINTGVASTLDYMNFTTSMHLSPGSAFFVLIPTDAGRPSHVLMEDNNRALKLEQWNNQNVLGYTRYTIADYSTTINPNYGANSIISFHKSNASNNVTVKQNGASQNLNIGSNPDGIPMARIGAPVVDDGPNFNCYEIITFSTLLNTAQIRIVENYLSAKYGSIAIPNDDYTRDTPANGNFDYDVAGILRISGTNLHNDSQSSIVRINNPNDFNNNEFFYWGHDNNALTLTNVSDAPVAGMARLERTWAVSENGDVGTMNVRFNLAGMGPVTMADLRLLIDTNGNGIFDEPSTTVISGATSPATDVYQFAGVNIGNAARFTIATVNSPLPVELLSFKGKVSNGVVELAWETASELNNDYFTIERSRDGITYEEILFVEGSGTTRSKKYYVAEDASAPAGRVYYRLKQTDFDRRFEYVGVLSLENKQQEVTISIYPNPAPVGKTCHVRISSDIPDDFNCTLSDLSGRHFNLITDRRSSGDVEVQIPEGLMEGIYVLTLVSNSSQLSVKERIVVVNR